MKVVYKRVNKSGSINIPVSVRRQQGMQPGDAMEVTVTNDNKIIIQPYKLRCTFCETTENVSSFYGKGICKECITKVVDHKEE